MNRWFLVAVAAAVLALLAPGAHRTVEAQPPAEVEAREVRGQPVVVNGRELRLWVFVFPAGPGPTNGTAANKCVDGNQSTPVPNFASAKPGGLTFNINRSSIPGDETFKNAATQAIKDAVAAWEAVNSSTYFTVNDTGGAARPAADGINTVGWVKIAPVNVLAATWVWTDTNNVITEVDIFYNSLQNWGVFTTCNAQDRYEVGNVGTHEVGHAVGKDHLQDPNGYATMYPSAPKGEVRKRTLTEGDKVGCGC